MTVVKSKALIALAVLTAALTIYSLINLLRIGVSEDGVALFLVGILNDVLGAIVAASMFFARRSTIKWFYASAACSLATVPIMKMQHPNYPTGMLIVMFLLIGLICGIIWAILMWKREALNQPVEVVANA